MLNPLRADMGGQSDRETTGATTINAQSERVMSISQSVFSELDDFLNGKADSKELSSIPKPQIDALSQIGSNLATTETTLNKISELISKLKSRIR